MSDSPWLIALSLLFAALPVQAASPPGPKPATCRAEVVEGELTAGQDLSRPIGGGLRLWFEATAAGWILRVVPDHGPVGEHDYAEVATPPYRSVTPLSVSTDFAFRAQDAVGWNPRRFRFATSAGSFERLLKAYQQVVDAGPTPPAALEGQLSDEITRAADGKLTIVDAKLVPGMADQWRMAGAVSTRFPATAHTLVQPADGKPSPLGKLLWVRFRVEFDLPAGFAPEKTLRIVPHICGNL